jgi:hypothetical protein
MPILPKPRSKSRSRLRDLTASQVIRVFRRESFLRRLFRSFVN